MWNLAYNDSKNIYGHDGPNKLAGQSSIQELCNTNGLIPSKDLRIVPINPIEPMVEGNLAIVDREGRIMLVNIWRNSANEQVYAHALLSLQTKDDEVKQDLSNGPSL